MRSNHSSRCIEFNTRLHKHIYSSCYSQAVQRIQSFPREVHILMELGSGVSPLYLACRDGNVSFHVIKALVDVWPEGVSTRSLEKGWTPLHLASCVSTDVRILEVLINADPQVVYVKDFEGRTPLFHLCHSYGSVLRQELDAVHVKDGTSMEKRNERTCCMQSFKLFLANASVLLKALAKLQISKERSSKRNCKQENKKFRQICHRPDDHQSTITPTKSNLVHDCINAGSHCPPALLDLSLRMNPHHLLEPNHEDDGNLPLHALCQRGDLSQLSTILSICPPCVARTCNQSGRLPLHILAERLGRGIFLHTGHAFRFSLDYMMQEHRDALSLLVKEYPGSIHRIETSTKLFPFMLAAAAATDAVDADGNDLMEMLRKNSPSSFVGPYPSSMLNSMLGDTLATPRCRGRRARRAFSVESNRDVSSLDVIYHLFREQPNILAYMDGW